MNAVEIEQAVSELFAEPLDATESPYAFLRAFGNKEMTLRRLRTGDTNKSDLGGVLAGTASTSRSRRQARSPKPWPPGDRLQPNAEIL